MTTDEVSTADMAAWLLNHVQWLRHHRAGHEAVEEITSAVLEVVRVIDRPRYRSTFAIGPCPELDCPGEVRVFIPADEQRAATMTCTVCGPRSDSLMNAGKRILATQQQRIAPYIDSAAAAAALGVTDRTIRRWVIGGVITNYGTPARIMLDMEELEAL